MDVVEQQAELQRRLFYFTSVPLLAAAFSQGSWFYLWPLVGSNNLEGESLEGSGPCCWHRWCQWVPSSSWPLQFNLDLLLNAAAPACWLLLSACLTPATWQ